MEPPKKKRRLNESQVAQRINKYLRRIQESIHRIISIKGNENMYLETLQQLTAAVNRWKEKNMDYALAVARFKAWQWDMHFNIARLLQAKQKYDNPSNFEKRATLLKFLQDLHLKMHNLEGIQGLTVAMRQWTSDIRSIGKKMSELKAAALAEGKSRKKAREEEADEIRDLESLNNIDFESLRQNFDASAGQGAGQGDVDEIRDLESLTNSYVESIRRRLMTEATTEAAEARREALLSRAIWEAIYELYQ